MVINFVKGLPLAVDKGLKSSHIDFGDWGLGSNHIGYVFGLKPHLLHHLKQCIFPIDEFCVEFLICDGVGGQLVELIVQG